MTDETERPLSGGRVTQGVVRIGDTVRRPVSADHTLQHDLLMHLEQRGFAGAPRFLGLDEAGREILSFLPGDVPDDLGPYDDAQIAAAARLLRAFHDANANFAKAHQAEVICHNDFSPTNAVFRERMPVAMIDFDTARPGLRLWDLGYTAFAWLDLGNDEYDAAAQIGRLKVLAAAYGEELCSAETVAAFALARQTALTISAGGRGHTELARWAKDCAVWTAENITERLLPTGYRGQSPSGHGLPVA